MPLIRAALLKQHGMTFIEIVVASILAALVAGGTLLAFVTAVRISHGSNLTDEAASLAQQTIDRFRSKIACDDSWYTSATCTANPPTGSISDNDPAISLPGGTRQYTVAQADCDGDGSVGDCLLMNVTVTWAPPQ